jgi:hypothetical protein
MRVLYILLLRHVLIHIRLRWCCLLSSCGFQPSRPDVGSETLGIISQNISILRSLLCLCEFRLSWSVSWELSCTGPQVLVQCVVPLAHSCRAHPPLSPVPFPTTDSGSRANPTERLRLTSRFSLDIPPETQSHKFVFYPVHTALKAMTQH